MSTQRERCDEIGKNIRRAIEASIYEEMGIGSHIMGTRGTNFLNTITPCAACKLLRRRCAEECPFSPYFSPLEPHKFAAVHKVFGASNVCKMLLEVPESQRVDAANSLVYEANVRLRDPVYGCMGSISALQQQVELLQAELNALRGEILRYKYREAANNNIAAASNPPITVSTGAAAAAAAAVVSVAVLPPPPSSSPTVHVSSSSSSSLYPTTATSMMEYASISTNSIPYFE